MTACGVSLSSVDITAHTDTDMPVIGGVRSKCGQAKAPMEKASEAGGEGEREGAWYVSHQVNN
jgi:hypothetical protein